MHKFFVNRSRIFFILGFLFLAGALFVNTTLANQSTTGNSKAFAQPSGAALPYDKQDDDNEDNSVLPPGIVFEDEEMARASDIALMAEQLSLPVKDVEVAVTFQEGFAEYVDELFARYPNQISAVWVEPVPSTQGHIRFVGNVPDEVATEIVVRNDYDLITVSENGLISMADHIRRAEMTAETLIELGYQNHVTFYDAPANVIQIEVKLPEGVAQPSTSDIVDALQQKLLSSPLEGSAASVTASDLTLTVIVGDGPMITLEHSRGGNWLRDDGVRECTSGWSVFGPNGDGIITAAHCSGLNQFEETSGTSYSMSWRKQVRGSGGDVEYHTTSHIEVDDFYATASTIRDVGYIRATNSMTGYGVCVYGRSSNSRNCSHVVEAVGVTVTISGVSTGNQARSNKHTTIGGDSGGGWSWNYTAWGVHTGGGGGKSYFTTIVEAERVLGVTVKR